MSPFSTPFFAPTGQVRRRAALLAAAALFALPLLVNAKGVELRLRTALAGGAISGLTPSGHADYRGSDGRARLNVEVEDINLPAGTKVDVLLNQEKIGVITISAAPIRGGELELNTQDGQPVPSVKPGAMVVVTDGDTPLVSGVLK